MSDMGIMRWRRNGYRLGRVCALIDKEVLGNALTGKCKKTTFPSFTTLQRGTVYTINVCRWPALWPEQSMRPVRPFHRYPYPITRTLHLLSAKATSWLRFVILDRAARLP